MTPLEISAIVGLIVALIAAIVVWTIVAIEYRKIRRQNKIDKIIKRIREREEDSGNESEGDMDDLAKLVDMGDFDHWVNDNL
nr:vpu protein [Human immunodeficiency virus 1]UTQ20005.1 vpu protein [Human immunodeficiency virus 1]UTQ20014.1 vpu protein [Human immunodeficiency virus 1]UTQ20023.1 vpu protein [Human immunodeficiency virus 1]UTQ20032.1 vpu protein [Human immunodeficiency virus 1]